MRGQETPASPTAGNAVPETTVRELKRRLDRNEELFILDVRNREEYQLCRLPGSTLIPLPELPSRFQELDRSRELIIHCKSGMRSLKALHFLREKGFTNLKNLKGGILAWADQIDPAMPKY